MKQLSIPKRYKENKKRIPPIRDICEKRNQLLKYCLKKE